MSGHVFCVHKGAHACLPTLWPDGRGLTLTKESSAASEIAHRDQLKGVLFRIQSALPSSRLP